MDFSTARHARTYQIQIARDIQLLQQKGDASSTSEYFAVRCPVNMYCEKVNKNISIRLNGIQRLLKLL